MNLWLILVGQPDPASGDHGRIVTEGTAAALRQQTSGRTLEDAFIALTGRSIREAEAEPVDRMRMMRRVRRGRR